MKTYGKRAELRYNEQEYYGHYCNKAREKNLTPISYVLFQQESRKIFKDDSNKKKMERLIKKTIECK